MFVLPVSCLDRAKRFGVPRDRIVTARPRNSLDVRGVHVDALRAIHGNRKGAVYYDANLDDCGYVLHLAGKTVLQPGDSVLLEDHLFLKHVNVLLFSPTEHNWLIEDSMTAILRLEPDVILPQHRDTYPLSEQNRFWAQGFPHEVRLLLPAALQKRYRVLEMGEMLVVK
jgi:L-ascorbate metabolism protein UlaG (beta-lactamase superfamily)